jgi:NAD(P)-dependent dehydrogenase (short-subunit alcohol dehydrogenase family)
MLEDRGVLVVVGIGGMGLAIARRCGSGARVLLADVSESLLDTAAAALREEGHDITVEPTDVADAASVHALAVAAGALGPVRGVVHTAGVSPVQAAATTVIAVDLLGAAYVLDAFAGVVSAGGAGVVIASMAGHLTPPLTADDERAIAEAAAGALASLPCVEAAARGDSGTAYAFAKQAAAARVRAAAVPWGRRGARVNAISPGVIATSMGRAELDGPSGAFMRLMVDASGTGRLGTPDDIAAATGFLLSPAASFITGVDLLVDGGVVAAMRSNQIDVATLAPR